MTKDNGGSGRTMANTAMQVSWELAELPSWSCGFDSRHPLFILLLLQV
jgi:hypothetical protein